MATSDILLAKAAADAGFDLDFGWNDGWRRFGVSGSALKVFLATRSGDFVVSVSSPAVAAELDIATSVDEGPTGIGPVLAVGQLEQLRALLRRIRLLDDSLPNRLLDQFQSEVVQADRTVREAMVRQRIGQDIFRKGLMEYWDRRCAISGLAVPELLRASHAKPWKNCSDEERLDVHNGLLLAAHLDAAFDSGLITILPDGRVAVSGILEANSRVLLGLDKKSIVKGLKEAHEPYLRWHREKVFIS